MVYLTGVHGKVYVDDVEVANATFSIKVTRGVATHNRGNSWSDVKAAGKLDMTGTINRIQTSVDFLGKVLTGSVLTGTANALHAGLTLDGSDAVTEMTDDDSKSSKIKFSCITSAITTAGTIVLRGTDANDEAITEEIAVGTLDVGEYVTSTKIYKTLEDVRVIGVDSTGNGLLKVDSVAGSANYSVGRPAYFKLKGELDDGTTVTYVEANNCFLTEGEFKFTDADEIVEDNLSFTMEDPSTLILVETASS